MSMEHRIVALLANKESISQIIFGIWLNFPNEKNIKKNISDENLNNLILKYKEEIYEKCINFLLASEKINEINSASPDESVFILIVFFNGIPFNYEVKIYPNEMEKSKEGEFSNEWILAKAEFFLEKNNIYDRERSSINNNINSISNNNANINFNRNNEKEFCFDFFKDISKVNFRPMSKYFNEKMLQVKKNYMNNHNINSFFRKSKNIIKNNNINNINNYNDIKNIANSMEIKTFTKQNSDNFKKIIDYRDSLNDLFGREKIIEKNENENENSNTNFISNSNNNLNMNIWKKNTNYENPNVNSNKNTNNNNNNLNFNRNSNNLIDRNEKYIDKRKITNEEKINLNYDYPLSMEKNIGRSNSVNINKKELIHTNQINNNNEMRNSQISNHYKNIPRQQSVNYIMKNPDKELTYWESFSKENEHKRVNSNSYFNSISNNNNNNKVNENYLINTNSNTNSQQIFQESETLTYNNSEAEASASKNINNINITNNTQRTNTYSKKNEKKFQSVNNEDTFFNITNSNMNIQTNSNFFDSQYRNCANVNYNYSNNNNFNNLNSNSNSKNNNNKRFIGSISNSNNNNNENKNINNNNNYNNNLFKVK
jgi:hypothetical protein